jgi:exoribonuclease R
MRDEINSILDDAFDKVNPSLDDIYNSNEILDNINEKIDLQNGDVNLEKRELIDILQRANDMGLNIQYSEEMSVEELEKLVNSIKA